MDAALYAIYIINCLFLILVVLLQAGRGGGLALAGAGSGSAQIFGSGGQASFMQNLTVFSAGLFMVLSMTLAYRSSTHAGDTQFDYVDEDPIETLETGAAAGGSGDEAPTEE